MKPKRRDAGKAVQNEGQKSTGSGEVPVILAAIVPGSIVNIIANITHKRC